MIYRRHTRATAWHSCRNCSAWLDESYEERTIEPARETLCAECRSKNEQLRCEVVPQPGAA
jgi:hypothetical protein